MAPKHREWADLPRPSWARPGDGPVAVDDEDNEGVEGGVRIRPESPLGDIQELEDAILEEPAEMLEELRDLYAQRERCGPIDPDLTDLGLAFKGVASRVDESFLQDHEKYNLAWSQLVDAGLGAFCEEVVGQEDFFGEHPYWIETILYLINTTVIWCIKRDLERSTLADQLKRIIDALCRNGHSHHELFDDRNMVLAIYAPGNPESAGDMRQHMHSMLYGSSHFYLLEENSSAIRLGATEAKHFREMCLYLWYYRTERNGWQGDVLLLLLTQSLDAASARDVTDFFDNTVVNAIGPSKFLAGVRDYLEQTEFPRPEYHEMLMRYLSHVLSTDPYRPHCYSSGFLAAVRAVIDFHAPCTDLAHWKVLESALELLAIFTDAAPVNDAASPLIRHIDVVELMSRCTLIFAQADFTNGENDVCVRIIKTYTRVATALGLRSGKNALRKDFRRAARRHWYRTLKTLRELPLRNVHATRKCAQLVPVWEGLGDALNLDEASEKADYERELKRVAQLCAWVQCEYHEKKPPHATRVCVGCGETRYCSRPCQQRDWKEGGHKQKCGKRLKSEPHQPR